MGRRCLHTGWSSRFWPSCWGRKGTINKGKYPTFNPGFWMAEIHEPSLDRMLAHIYLSAYVALKSAMREEGEFLVSNPSCVYVDEVYSVYPFAGFHTTMSILNAATAPYVFYKKVKAGRSLFNQRSLRSC